MLDFVFGFASFAVDSTLDSASNLMRDFALGFTLDSSLSPPHLRFLQNRQSLQNLL